RPAEGAAAARVSDPPDAADPGVHPGAHHQPCPGGPRAVAAAAALATPAPVPAVAAHPGAPRRHRGPAPARQIARGGPDVGTVPEAACGLARPEEALHRKRLSSPFTS